MASSSISAFLQARRARLSPAELGLRPAPGRRRVPGLRREELAQLAGLSVDYYVQLEQGRRPRASVAVLDALARALRLTPVEREHMATLVAAGAARPVTDTAAGPPPARPGAEAAGRAAAGSTGRPTPAHHLQPLLDLLDRVPALVLGRRMDVIAWNAAANAVFDFSSWPSTTPNGAREVFQRSDARQRYPDWQHLAEEIVANLHRDAGRHPADRRLSALVGELSMASVDFRQLWARHDVRQKDAGPSRMVHPLVGELVFTYRSLSAQASADQLLMTYTYEPDSMTDERLRLLMSWTSIPSPSPSESQGESSDRYSSAAEGSWPNPG